MAIQQYGLDLGTGSIKIYKEGHGMVLKEKNMIAIRKKTEVSAFGDDAYALFERSSDLVRVTSPMKHGVIAGLRDMQILLDLFLKKIKCSSGFIKSNIFYFSVPSNLTEVEKRAFFDLAMGSEFKTKDLYLVEKPIAALLGEGINIKKTPGTMLIDFGYDTVEISVMAMGGIITSRLLQFGGRALDLAICSLIKEKYQLIIGMKTAESLKVKLGSACGTSSEHMRVTGRHLISGLPAAANVSADSVDEAIHNYVQYTAEAVRQIFDQIPPEIYRVIEMDGILLTGEGSRLSNLDIYLEQKLGVPILLSQKPDQSVIIGLGVIMGDPRMTKLASSVKEAIFN